MYMNDKYYKYSKYPLIGNAHKVMVNKDHEYINKDSKQW